MNDDRIIALFFSRNKKAIEQTDKKYGKYCYSIAYNILNDHPDSEETVNDTYLKLWNTIPPEKPSVFSAFIAKITRHLSIDRYRKAMAEKRGFGETPLILEELSECVTDKKTDIHKELEIKELTELINSFLENLPSTERKVFVCRYWYGDSIKSISRQFGFSESKIKSMLFRLRNKLKDVLIKEGFSV